MRFFHYIDPINHYPCLNRLYALLYGDSMSEYEISYVTDPSLAEEARAEVDSFVDSEIEKASGSISSNTPSTRRRLSYPVQKQFVGFLRTVQATVDPEKIEVIRAALRKQTGVIRLQVLQTPQREEVPLSRFESMTTKQQVEPKKAETTEAKKPEVKMSDTELEEKIESALDEEVK